MILYTRIVTKKYHIPVLKGLQIPYTQNPWQDLKVDYGMENSDESSVITIYLACFLSGFQGFLSFNLTNHQSLS